MREPRAHLLLDAQWVDVAVGHRPREEPVRVVAGHEQRHQHQAEDEEQDTSGGTTGIAACHCFSSESFNSLGGANGGSRAEVGGGWAGWELDREQLRGGSSA